MKIEVTEMVNGKLTTKTVDLGPQPELERQMEVARAAWAEEDKIAGDCAHDGDVEYYEDGEHPRCSKHCWACKSCGAIVQVG